MLTNNLRVIRHAWHFNYALVLVVKVVCGSTALRASHLNWALGTFASQVNFSHNSEQLWVRHLEICSKWRNFCSCVQNLLGVGSGRVILFVLS